MSPAIREHVPRDGVRITHTNRAKRSKILKVFCGIDWSEDHHDVAIIDAEGP